jgi:hypothetical protein
VPLEPYLGEEINFGKINFGNRLDDLAYAYREAWENAYEARKYNRDNIKSTAS